MESITYYVAMGGPFMYAVLGTLCCALVGAVGGGIAYGWKRWAGILIFLVFGGLPVCSGAIGTTLGMIQTKQAASSASPEMVGELVEHGTELSMYPSYLALGEFCVCFGIFVVLALISAAVFRRRRYKKLMEED